MMTRFFIISLVLSSFLWSTDLNAECSVHTFSKMMDTLWACQDQDQCATNTNCRKECINSCKSNCNASHCSKVQRLNACVYGGL